MSTEAYVTNTNNQRESHGLTSLDIVRHAVKTLAQSMGPEDRISVVTFGSDATVISKLTYMDDNSKPLLLNTLDLLDSRAHTTNLWAGLNTGTRLLSEAAQPGRVSSLFLLTDGCANISPPRGEIGQFQKLKDDIKIPFSLNTFGFGYDIDSKLLYNLAVNGNGMFSFIPDASMVGTAFVNAVANVYTSVSNNSTVTVKSEGGTKVYGARHPIKHLDESTKQIESCSPQIGQSKDFIFDVITFPGDAPHNYTASFTQNVLGNSPSRVSISRNQMPASERKSKEAQFHEHRLEAAQIILAAVESLDSPSNTNPYSSTSSKDDARLRESASHAISQLVRAMAPAAKNDHRVAALMQDLEGQVSIALSNYDYYNRWGRHYLRSLARAHQLQVCSNFKDPGVQVYGGTLFKELRDKIEDLYITMPAPKASGNPRVLAYTPRTFTWTSYHDAGRVCFDGNCSVLMGDGSTSLVKNVKRGDKVMTPSGKEVEVECVVKTHCENERAKLCEVSSPNSEQSLLVTPYHPIRIGGTWMFPCDIAPTWQRACAAVYSFALKEDHVMIIGGVECVTLGHGFEDNEAVKHPFFGTEKVIEALKKCQGWKSGLVEFAEGCLVRDQHTGLVCALTNERVASTSPRQLLERFHPVLIVEQGHY